LPSADTGRIGSVEVGILGKLSHITQRLICGVELKASDSKIGKRQKQEYHHETVNDNRLKRDGTALIRYE
jgi:hypothetical protein